ncbi:MAG: carbonic anhydrase [Haloarculaceae archaeon]
MTTTIRELLASNRDHAAAEQSRFDHLQDGQTPEAVSVCCSDSRVLQDHLWGVDEPGRLFTVGTIGNRVLQHTEEGEVVVAGDVLYPLVNTGTDTAMVVGHTGCGAVTATFNALTGSSQGESGATGNAASAGGDDAKTAAADEAVPPGIRACIDLLGPQLRPGVEALPAGIDRSAAIDRLVEYNVDRQIDCLRESDDVPADTDIVGVVYDFQDVYDGRRGEVHVVNVDGETDAETLRSAHPEVADRIDRLADLG